MKFHGDKTLILTVVVATGSFLLAACSSVPKWVDKGGGYMTEKDGKAFYGVGAVTGIRNEPLAKETADNRARAELAKLDLDKFKEQVGQMKELNDAARDFVRKNAEKAFERLQQEEDKRGAK